MILPSAAAQRQWLALAVVELLALMAQRLPTGSFATVFRLDVVSGVAFRVVVMHGLLDGMPRRCFHCPFLPVVSLPVCNSVIFRAGPKVER
jgi:hypothetical protein